MTALVIDRLGRVSTQSYLYACAGLHSLVSNFSEF